MNRLYITATIALLLIAKLGICQASKSSNGDCGETTLLVSKIAAAKIRFEEVQYRKIKGQQKAKKYYFALVKEFMDKSKMLIREACLNRLIADSIATAKNDVYFTYLPPISSRIEKCNYLPYVPFLKIMLANLNSKNNDSTIICFPELIK